MAMFSLSFSEIAVTAQQDLFQLQATTVPIKIHRVTLSQSSDVGDAQSEGLSILIREVTDTVTDDGGEQALDRNNPGTFSGACAINETTELTTGAATLHSEAWNILSPFVYLPTPEERISIDIGNAVVVNLNTTPADSITMSGTIVFETD